MCDQNVGVAKKIDVERVSKDIAELIKALDKEVKGDEVHVPVKKVKDVSEKLARIIK
jgi:hypothetical protein